jgi:hypothetical protein
MRPTTTLIALLLAASTATAVDLKVPERVEAKKNEFVVIKAETPGKTVKYTLLDPGLAMFPSSELKDPKTAVVFASEEGEYRVAAITAKGDELSEFKIILVVVGKPKPKPDPIDPVKPDQPDPELLRSLQAAYAGEGEGKAESAKGLAALYLMAAKADFLDKVKTWKQLHEAMGLAAQTLGVKGKIPGVQREVSAHFQKRKLPSPTSTASLDADGRTLASKEFKAVAVALGALK